MNSLQLTKQIATDHNIHLCEDLSFLLGVAVNLEQRTDKWHNRTARSLNLALTMNQLADFRVPKEQLTAAVLAHDIGMGFLPIDVLTKPGKLSARERKTMQAHIKSAADLIHRMRGWDEARIMIRSHHERMDGSGYPDQRCEVEICDGAKILGIVDTFTAQGSSSLMHGVLEIHRYSGSHFSQDWVKHFEAAVKMIYQTTMGQQRSSSA